MIQIRTPDQRLRVFISSTMNELADERAAAKRAIERLRLTPVLFELGARPYPPRELYLAYLSQSDVFIGIYGQQYGWVAPGRDVSGLEDEFLAAGDKPKLVYVQSPAPDRDPRLAEMLRRVQQSGLSYHTFKHARDLARLISDDLAVLLSDRFGAAPQQAPAASPPPQVSSPVSSRAVTSPPSEIQATAKVGRDVPGAGNRFIGRERELAMLGRLLLDGQTRLVTLVGPGGIGKTRLAMQSLTTVAPEFDEVAIAQLDQVSPEQSLVASAIASAMGISEGTSTPVLDSIAGYIGSRRVLLMLDGFEHIIDSAPLVAALVARTTRLTVLVTSRETLHLTGERVIDVPPLAVPTWSDSAEAARSSDSVQLFADRATAAGAGLPLDDAQVRTIGEICQRLDGIPLAIELAAPRLRMLDVDELSRRLNTSLATLTGGARDLPPRQRALRSTIAWSYDLLDEPDQLLFARLGVFAGGFALDAAEAICADERVPSVFDGISSLVDKALVRPDHSLDGQPRFAMRQVIREYADDRLAAAGERDEMRRRHAGFYRQLVIDLSRQLRAGEMRPAVAQHIADQDNIRSALQCFIDARDGDATAQIGLAAWPLWFMQSQYTEGLELMDHALQADLMLSDDSRADLMLTLGMMAFERGEYARADSVLQPALDRYVQRGDTHRVATASIPLGVMAALQHSAEGDSMLRRSIDDLRRLDDKWELGFALLALGTTLVLVHRENDAIAPLEEGAKIARAGDERIMLSNALIGLGCARIGQHDLAGAPGPLREAIHLAIELSNVETIARALDAFATLSLLTGDVSQGAILFGAATGMRRSVGADVWAVDRADQADTAEQLRARLGDQTYRQLLDQGGALALNEVLNMTAALDPRKHQQA
jgi:predicted ATPase